MPPPKGVSPWRISAFVSRDCFSDPLPLLVSFQGIDGGGEARADCDLALSPLPLRVWRSKSSKTLAISFCRRESWATGAPASSLSKYRAFSAASGQHVAGTVRSWIFELLLTVTHGLLVRFDLRQQAPDLGKLLGRHAAAPIQIDGLVCHGRPCMANAPGGIASVAASRFKAASRSRGSMSTSCLENMAERLEGKSMVVETRR
jgi:hypothetical protein